MKPSRSFASDNNAVVHAEVLKAIRRANEGHVVGYGDDPHTESAVRNSASILDLMWPSFSFSMGQPQTC